ARGPLQVPGLAGREIVVDDDHAGLAGAFSFLSGFGFLRLGLVGLPARPGLALARRGTGGDHPLAPGELGELLELALPEHRARREHAEALRDRAQDLEAQGVDEPAELGEVGSV